MRRLIWTAGLLSETVDWAPRLSHETGHPERATSDPTVLCTSADPDLPPSSGRRGGQALEASGPSSWGGNDILLVSDAGEIDTLAVLPPSPNPLPFGPPVYQAVPTGLALGLNGDILVGQLTGFPFPPAGASVFSLGGAVLDTLATGFTNLIDVALGANGSVYALEIDSDSLLGPSTTGSLFELSADGVRTLLFGGLESPTGLALGEDGLIYVAENGLSPLDGRVVALAPVAPVPLPASLALMAAALAGLVGLRRLQHPPSMDRSA